MELCQLVVGRGLGRPRGIPGAERRAIPTKQMQACGIVQRSCAPALHSSMPSAASPYGLPTSSLPDLVILK